MDATVLSENSAESSSDSSVGLRERRERANRSCLEVKRIGAHVKAADYGRPIAQIVP